MGALGPVLDTRHQTDDEETLGLPRQTFCDQIADVLVKNHVKSTRACLQRLMGVDEGRDICKDSKWNEVGSACPCRNAA